MKTPKLFLAAACAFCLSTVAFAQTTPSTTSGTTTTGTMQNGTMQNGTMTTPNQSTTDMNRGTMQNGTMNGRMDRKSKMNGQKGMKKTKMSSSSTSGSM